MLEALEESQRAQRQLVADASHELRTPIASLRTNLEVLLRNPSLAGEEHTLLLTDLVEQSAELGELVADLLESARHGDETSLPEELRLDDLVSVEVERLRTRQPLVTAELARCVVIGRETRLRRAVANLLDNAAKWSPAGACIDVRLCDGELTVRDRGPGFSAEDLPHVFDRFYRSAAARAVPGSGLGLSIVAKVAAEHGGAVHATNAPDGGALVALALPLVDGGSGNGSRVQLATR
jgi:two-component system sensor histidine kinase MprB